MICGTNISNIVTSHKGISYKNFYEATGARICGQPSSRYAVQRVNYTRSLPEKKVNAPINPPHTMFFSLQGAERGRAADAVGHGGPGGV